MRLSLENILADMADTGAVTSKTAADSSNTEASMLEVVRSLTENTKTAAAAQGGDAVAALQKIAADNAAAEDHALVKQAQLLGASMCDGFMSRLAGYDSAVAEKVAHFEKHARKIAPSTNRAREVLQSLAGTGAIGAAMAAPIGAAAGGVANYVADDDPSVSGVLGGMGRGALVGGGLGAASLLPSMYLGSRATENMGAALRGHYGNPIDGLGGLIMGGVGGTTAAGLAGGVMGGRSGTHTKEAADPSLLAARALASAGYGAGAGALTGGVAGAIHSDADNIPDHMVDALRGAGVGGLAGAGLGLVGGGLRAMHVDSLPTPARSAYGGPAAQRRMSRMGDALTNTSLPLGAVGGYAAGAFAPRDYEQGQEDALQEIHKVASDVHFAGQQSAANVLAALAGSR